MKPQNGGAAVPELLLERYRLGEVSAAEKAEIERQLRGDAALRDRLDEIARSDDAIRKDGFGDLLASRLRGAAARPASRLREETRSSIRLLRWALPAAVGVAAVVVVIASRTGPVPPAGDDRIKGLQPSLSVFRQTPRGSEVVSDGMAAHPGDVVRLAYRAAGQSYGVIVSIDGRGTVTVHLPPNGRQAVRLATGDRVLLDHAYELDDAPSYECFYFVTARTPFDAGAIIDAAAREASGHPASPPARLALGQRFEQSTFVLRKQP